MNIEKFCEEYFVERKGTACLKWDSLEENFGNKDLLPLWVADMEFKIPKEAVDAIKKRADHGAFGYSFVTDDYFKAYLNWQKKHHNMDIKKEEIRFSTGIVVALYWLINTFTKIDESVIIMTPVYYPFHNAVIDTGRKLITYELENNNGIYTIDFDSFEKHIINNNSKLFILCSPHNPVGRVWTEEELDKILSICEKHNVLVLSDEIHQDFTVFGHKFISSSNVSGGKYKNILITLNSASKSFNMAGLINSHIIIYNEEIRKKYDAYSKTVNQTEANLMGIVAMEAAYKYGEEWLSNVINVIKHNYIYIKEEIDKNIPNVVISPMEGTYLMWLDLRPYVNPDDLVDFMQNKCKLAVDYGDWFGTNTKGFIRINLATHPKYIKTAISNIIENIK